MEGTRRRNGRKIFGELICIYEADTASENYFLQNYKNINASLVFYRK